MTASEVKQLFNEGHAIYATPSTSSDTVFIPVYEYADTTSNTVFQTEQTVISWVSGHASIIGRIRYQFDLVNLTYTQNLIPLKEPAPNAYVTDTPTGTINAGDSLIRDITASYTKTMGSPAIAYCCPSATWNDELLVVNARVKEVLSDTQLVVRYKIYNPSSTTQTLAGSVNIGIYG